MIAYTPSPFADEAARTANPVQTTAFTGMKNGLFGSAFDAGNPFRSDDFPLVRALSGSWIEHLTTRCGCGSGPKAGGAISSVFPMELVRQGREGLQLNGCRSPRNAEDRFPTLYRERDYDEPQEGLRA